MSESRTKTGKKKVRKCFAKAEATFTRSSPPGTLRSPEDKWVWVIWNSDKRQKIIGEGLSASAAWADAARKL